MDPSQPVITPEFAAQDKGPAIIASICTVTVLETLFCLARLYTRGRILGKLHLDDYLIVLSVICGWCAVIFGVMAVHSGNGKHFAILTTEQKSGAILWTIVGFCPGIMSFGLPKLAVIALLTRLMNPSRWHRIFLWCLGIWCNISLLGCVFVLFAQCTPARSQWDFSITDKTCWSPWVLVDYAIYAGSFSAATDLYLAVYPAIVLFKLNLKLRKKIALSAALGIGSVATVIAIYKTTRLPNLASEDFSFDTSDLVIWTCIEGSTIIIASCIPVLQPLVDRVVGTSFFGGSSGRAYKNYGSERTGGRMKSDIELSSGQRMGGRRGGGGGGPRDPNGLTFLDDKAGSEESILRAEDNRTDKGSVAEERGPRGGGGKILRTDVVTVSYASHSTDNVNDAKRWNRGL
ncbi:hypothetical protein VTK73DRAFT_9567 [Phialemonium thermophilum]|uniref:Rhodopsin domain-containing protein n=1 Tax=Phialemonium thermophilum TaxID=223376 RepID=A0ABR3W1P6_9PEZI